MTTVTSILVIMISAQDDTYGFQIVNHFFFFLLQVCVYIDVYSEGHKIELCHIIMTVGLV